MVLVGMPATRSNASLFMTARSCARRASVFSFVVIVVNDAAQVKGRRGFYDFMPKSLQIFFRSLTGVNASEKNSEGPSKGLFAENAAFLAVPIISFIKIPFFVKLVAMILDFSLNDSLSLFDVTKVRYGIM